MGTRTKKIIKLELERKSLVAKRAEIRGKIIKLNNQINQMKFREKQKNLLTHIDLRK